MSVPELKNLPETECCSRVEEKTWVFDNIHQVPKIEKVVLNSSFGAEMDKNGIEELRKDISSLAGQAPVTVKAKVSVSNFKLRQGMPVGIKVTLRKWNVGIPPKSHCYRPPKY